MDSVPAQVLVPLAAAGVSAAFPRRGAPAVAAGLGALGSMQDYKASNVRLQELTDEHKRREEALRLFDNPDGPRAAAPQAGIAPQTNLLVQNAAVETTGQPGGHPGQVDPRVRDVLKARALMGDYKGAFEDYGKELQRAQQNAQLPSLEALQGLDRSKLPFKISGKLNNGMEFSAEPEAQPTYNVSEFTDAQNHRQQVAVNTKMPGVREQTDLGPVQTEKTGDEMGFAEAKRRDPSMTWEKYQRILAAAKHVTTPEETNPEKTSLVAALADFNRNNPNATPAERSQFVTLMKQGVNVKDLDAISDMLGQGGAGQGKALIGMQQAVGRGGAPVRSYILGRTLRMYPGFDPSAVDRKIAVMQEYADPKTPPGRSLQAFNTFFRHVDQLANVVDRFKTTNMSILNTPLNKLRKMTGDPDIYDLVSSIEPVKYEYATFMKNGNALTDQDVQAANSLINENLAPSQILTVASRMGHTAKARMEEINHSFKRTMGFNIPDLYSDQSAEAVQKFGGGTDLDPGFKFTAKDPKSGKRIGSNDGQNWQPIN